MPKIVPTTPGMKIGSRNADVPNLKEFLRRFGYYSSAVPAHITGTDRDLFGQGTQQALSRFQQFHNLPQTGITDAPTLATMALPRCGFPDLPAYSVSATKWAKRSISYAVETNPANLTMAEVRRAVQTALGLWSAVTGLQFQEVAAAPDIRIRFELGNHGDGSPFDGAGNVLAHAFYPPPNGGGLAGDAHFDDAETWTVTIPPASGSFDLVTVAAHEFGHSLGLAHSAVGGSLMFPTYSGPHRFLSADDVSGIQSLYGTNDEPAWISALYADLLGRDPDKAGLDSWVAARLAGASLESVVTGFLNSSEYCGNLATSFYATFLGRAPDPGGLQSWASQLAAGTARQDVQLGFLDSAEYKGANPVPDQFVESLYQRLLGRASDPTGKQGWIDALAAGAATADIIRGFLFSQEYCTQRVSDLYESLLGRAPEPAGIAGWVGQLTGGVSFQSIQVGFLASPEYRARALTRF